MSRPETWRENGFFPPRELIEQLERDYPQGQRVKAVRFSYSDHDMVDDNETVPPGTKGTVTGHDDAGTLFVRWDNGRRLGVLVLLDDVVEKIQ